MYTVHAIGGRPLRWGVFDPDGWLVDSFETREEAEQECDRLRDEHRERKTK